MDSRRARLERHVNGESQESACTWKTTILYHRDISAKYMLMTNSFWELLMDMNNEPQHLVYPADIYQPHGGKWTSALVDGLAVEKRPCHGWILRTRALSDGSWAWDWTENLTCSARS